MSLPLITEPLQFKLGDAQTSEQYLPFPSIRYQNITDQSLPNNDQDQVALDIRPPLRSMLAYPEPSAPPRSMLAYSEPSALCIPHTSIPSFPLLEATLVEDEPEELEEPVYVAGAVQDGAWWKQHQKYIFVGLISLVIGALVATVVMLVGSQNNDHGNQNIMTNTLQSTAPTESSSHLTTSTSAFATSNLYYYADKENKRCDSDPSGRPSANLRQRVFESIEECCEAE